MEYVYGRGTHQPRLAPPFIQFSPNVDELPPSYSHLTCTAILGLRRCVGDACGAPESAVVNLGRLSDHHPRRSALSILADPPVTSCVFLPSFPPSSGSIEAVLRNRERTTSVLRNLERTTQSRPYYVPATDAAGMVMLAPLVIGDQPRSPSS